MKSIVAAFLSQNLYSKLGQGNHIYRSKKRAEQELLGLLLKELLVEDTGKIDCSSQVRVLFDWKSDPQREWDNNRDYLCRQRTAESNRQ